MRYASDTVYVGQLDSPDGIGEAGLSGSHVGSRLAVRFTVNEHEGRLERVRVQIFGCGFTIASCVAAAELAEGRTLENAEKLGTEEINRVLGYGLPTDRAYCAALACSALRAALKSVRDGGQCVSVEQTPGLALDIDQSSRISADDPLLQQLLQSAKNTRWSECDSLLFAGVLTLACREQPGLPDTSGLSESELDALLQRYFPDCTKTLFAGQEQTEVEKFSVIPDPQLVALIHSYIPCDEEGTLRPASRWLANIIAVRCDQPGHLWVAMGCANRPDLSAAINRHLPALAEANNRGMRWKRFLFKQLCEIRGGVLCKAPTCGECSDYSLCFTDE